MSTKDRAAIHAMWMRVVLILGVGAVAALAHCKADEVIEAMTTTAVVVFLLF